MEFSIITPCTFKTDKITQFSFSLYFHLWEENCCKLFTKKLRGNIRKYQVSWFSQFFIVDLVVTFDLIHVHLHVACIFVFLWKIFKTNRNYLPNRLMKINNIIQIARLSNTKGCGGRTYTSCFLDHCTRKKLKGWMPTLFRLSNLYFLFRWSLSKFCSEIAVLKFLEISFKSTR